MSKTEKIFFGISIVMLISMVFFEMYHKKSRTEEEYYPCKIMEIADDGSYLVELPAGDSIWIEIEDEEISKDGKFVTLKVSTSYNGFGKILHQTVINTGIIKK